MATAREIQVTPSIKSEPDEEELPLPEHVTVLTVKEEDVEESTVDAVGEDPLAADADFLRSLGVKQEPVLQLKEEPLNSPSDEDGEPNGVKEEEAVEAGIHEEMEDIPVATLDGGAGVSAPETSRSCASPWKLRASAACAPLHLKAQQSKMCPAEMHCVELFVCDVCGMKFSYKPHWQTHCLVHRGERLFECGVCGKKFSVKGSLKAHSRVHTGERPFECGICGKKFFQASNLRMHSRLHTGERPFECGVCGKRFSEKGNLKTHSRVHTGERPFKCGVCGRQFSHKPRLNTHSRIHRTETL